MHTKREADLHECLTQVYYWLTDQAFALPRPELRRRVCATLNLPDLVGVTLAEHGIDESEPVEWLHDEE